jgi:hypothetical protein
MAKLAAGGFGCMDSSIGQISKRILNKNPSFLLLLLGIKQERPSLAMDM